MIYTLFANNRELALNETELLGPLVGYIENEDQVIYGSYPKDTPVHIEYDASTGEYMVESSVHLQVTSDMTLTLRVKYQNITVSNNAVLTIDDGIICQATDTITVEELKKLKPLRDSLHEKHLYQGIIYDGFIENGGWYLRKDQLDQAFDLYKEKRKYDWFFNKNLSFIIIRNKQNF